MQAFFYRLNLILADQEAGRGKKQCAGDSHDKVTCALPVKMILRLGATAPGVSLILDAVAFQSFLYNSHGFYHQHVDFL